MNVVCCVSFFLSLECKVQALRGLQFHHQCDLLTVGTWSFIFLSKVEGIKEDKKLQPFPALHCLLDFFVCNGHAFEVLWFYVLVQQFSFLLCMFFILFILRPSLL